MSTIKPQLRPELIARVQRENPAVKELTGPVVPTEKYVSGWELEDVALASRLIAVSPQLLEAQEKKHPAIAKMMRDVEKAVLSTLPLQGAVIGIVLGAADRYGDDGIVAADLHALSLEKPYVSDERLGTLYVDSYGDAAYVHLEKDKVAVEPHVEPTPYTTARDKDVLQTVRDLFEDAGGRLSGAPTEGYGSSKDGKLLLDFDYGTPQSLSTPSGVYGFASGSTSGGDRDDFMRRLNDHFDVTVVTPQRDDSRFSPDSHRFQHESSGPVLELTPKKVLHPWRNMPESMKAPEGFSEEAATRLLDGFAQHPQATDKQLNPAETANLLKAVQDRRESLQKMDQTEKDSDPRPGHVKNADYDTVESRFSEGDISTLVTNKYFGSTWQLERKTDNGFVGIELEGAGRYADGLAYEITPTGARVRELHFKETI